MAHIPAELTKPLSRLWGGGRAYEQLPHSQNIIDADKPPV